MSAPVQMDIADATIALLALQLNVPKQSSEQMRTLYMETADRINRAIDAAYNVSYAQAVAEHGNQATAEQVDAAKRWLLDEVGAR